MKTNQSLKFSEARALVAGALALAGLLILAACGSTSSLQDTHGKALTSARKFTKVTVQDFKSTASNHPEKVNQARVNFANHIAAELKRRGNFSSVSRNAKLDANTLVISGTITKYDEGSVAKRMLVGMGFGMAVFEANVEFRDSKGLPIGMIKVDKNSWPLGGIIGAVSKPEDFMEGAAQKVAEEAGKLTRSAVKPTPPPAKATPTPVKKTPPAPAKKTPTPQPRSSNSGR
jgi:hypothetical protein